MDWGRKTAGKSDGYAAGSKYAHTNDGHENDLPEGPGDYDKDLESNIDGGEHGDMLIDSKSTTTDLREGRQEEQEELYVPLVRERRHHNVALPPGGDGIFRGALDNFDLKDNEGLERDAGGFPTPLE